MKLRQKIEQSSSILNAVIHETLSAEHKINTLDTVFDFKLVPIKEALFKIIEANKEVMVTMFQENIRGRLLIYYLTQFPIAFTSSDKRIHWNEKIM